MHSMDEYALPQQLKRIVSETVEVVALVELGTGLAGWLVVACFLSAPALAHHADSDVAASDRLSISRTEPLSSQTLSDTAGAHAP